MEIVNYNSEELFDVSMFEIDQKKQMVNLTKIAQAFGKRLDIWKDNTNTRAFLKVFESKNPNTPLTVSLSYVNVVH